MGYNYEYYFDEIPMNGYIAANAIVGAVMSFIGMFLFFGCLLYIFKAVYSYVLFKKMGRKGWEGIIPIYNKIIKLQVLNIPIWMIIFAFIPGANVALSVVIAINIARKFNKDILFTIGLIFIPIVFYPILAFGSDEFNPDANGIFDENNNINSSKYNFGYCTKCGTKLTGKYCSSCGTKSDV